MSNVSTHQLSGLSTQGKVTYVFALLMSVVLLLGSFVSQFVPNVFAAVSLTELQYFEGELFNTDCTNWGDYRVGMRILDPDDPENTANYRAYYEIDGGTQYVEITSGNGDVEYGSGYALFGMYAPCGDAQYFYDDGQVHTFQLIGYNVSTDQYYYSDVYNFTIDDPSTNGTEIEIVWNDTTAQETDSVLINQDYVDLNFGQDIWGDALATGSAVSSITYSIPSEAISDNATIDFGTLGVDGEIDFYIDLDQYSLPDGVYNMQVMADTTDPVETMRNLEVTIDMVSGTMGVALDNLSGGEITIGASPAQITGTATTDSGNVDTVTLDISSLGYSVAATADDGAFDEPEEAFTATIDTAQVLDGTYSASVTAVSDTAVEGVENFTLILNADNEAPTCTGWANQTINWENPLTNAQDTPNYSDAYTYAGINCTDNVGITTIQYRADHQTLGEIFDTAGDGYIVVNESNFDVGLYGESEVGLDLDIALPGDQNYQGAIDIYMKVTDASGNINTYRDRLTIDYTDNTAPQLSVQMVRPELLTDTTPTITGTCTDAWYVEKNSNISAVEVNVDNGGWVNATPLDGSLNSRTERFAYTTPELGTGTHNILVRCTDAAANTATTAGDDIISFTISEPSASDEAIPETYDEFFDTHEFQDYAGSTLVWGNGKLRLKEAITVSRTAIDTANFRDVNAPDNSSQFFIVEGVESNIAWYAKDTELWRLDRSNNSITQFDEESYSLGGGNHPAFASIRDVVEVVYGGDRILFVGTDSGLSIFNITDGTSSRSNSAGGVGNIIPDLDRGRTGVYVNTDNETAGEMKVSYWHLNSDLSNAFSGDTLTAMPANTASMTGTNVVEMWDSPVANEYYISIFTNGLHRYNDNNTPDNFADDQSTRIISNTDGHPNFDVVFATTFDPDGRLILGTSPSENGEIYVVNSDGGTPYDNSDDEVFQLAQSNHLAYNDVFGLEYVEGLNGVGDQLFIRMEHGNPVYLNFNDTYSDPLDDTFIELHTNNDIRPSMTKFIVDDYNTLYANIDRQGLFQIDLNRDWEATGSAIALPPRPSKSLAINNFVAEASTIDPIALIPGTDALLAQEESGVGGWIPQAYAQSTNIVYEVTLDDGVTWEPLTLGELQTLSTEDYRLQFRITMTPIDGSSPVVNTYSVEYGGYPDPDEIGVVQSFNVAVSPSSFAKGANFTIDLDAVDTLGYVVNDYNESVTLQLLNQSNEDKTSLLNLNQMTFVNGEITTTGAVITEPGTYTLKVTNADGTGTSGSFTVTDSQTIVPTLTFTSNNYNPRPHQGFTLRWTTTNMTNAELNGQAVDVNGSRDLSVTDDTDYVLRAWGPYGTLSSTIDINVDRVSPSPTPEPTATPTPSPGTGIGTTPFVPVGDGSELVDESATDEGETPGGDNGDSDDRSGEDGTGGPTINGPDEDITILEGEKVKIWWEAEGADSVVVDYLGGTVGSTGEFQFFGRETQVITITARKGDQVTTKTITVTVKKLPFGLGSILPEIALPIVAAAIRYGAFSWLVAFGILKLLAFFKRKPDDEIETSWVSDAIKQFQVALWVISPIMLLLSILAAGILGGPWLIGIMILCVLVMLRHLVQWSKTWTKRNIAG